MMVTTTTATDESNSGCEDFENKIDAAVRASRSWSAWAVEERAEVLTRLATNVWNAHDELVEILIDEVGKPRTESSAEVSAAVKILRFFAGWPLWGHSGRVGELSSLTDAQVLLKPRGVVGIITPWNYPLTSPTQKLAAALVTGNVALWHPSSRCPRTSELLAELFADAGLPDAVLTLFRNSIKDEARKIVSDQRVSAISFTGSTAVGREVHAVASARHAAVQCEMGGKNAAVVLADAHLRHAARRLAYGAFSYAGQKCTAVSRIYVEDAVADTFHTYLLEETKALGFGSPYDRSTVVGPVISASKRVELERVCEQAESRGLIRQTMADGGVVNDGLESYFAPVVFDMVPEDDPLMSTELFGPVLAVARVSGLEMGIQRVNDNEYGLAACIFTSNRDAARRFASAVEVGTVKINDSTPGLSIMLPFYGWKASGSGAGELGDESIRFFTKPTSVIG